MVRGMEGGREGGAEGEVEGEGEGKRIQLTFTTAPPSDFSPSDGFDI